MQMVNVKQTMKLYAKHPPQKNAGALMAMVPDSAMEGINTNPNTTIKPINFASTGCNPKKYLQTAKLLFRAAKPRNVPINEPVNIATDISASLGSVLSKPDIRVV